MYLDGVIMARAAVRRAGGEWGVEDLRLFAIGDSQQAPYVRPARTTNVRQFTPAPRQTVRLVAPARYRRVHLADADDTAVQVMTHIAKASGVPVSTLSGGQWAWNKVKEEWHLTGHLRLSQAPRAFSSRCFRLPSRQIPEFSGGLARPLKTMATTTGCAWRKLSLEASLCASGPGEGLTLELLPSVLEAQGYPNAWAASQVADFFASQSWSDVEVLARRRRGKQRFLWIVKASPPPDEPLDHDRLQVWQLQRR